MTEQKIKLRASALTSVGRVRSHNEDNIHLWSINDGLLLAIVADGMGGAAAGEEASRIAVETIMSHLSMQDHPEQTLDIPADELSSAVQAANLSIMREAVDHPRQRGMGTTLTMVFIRDNVARFAHVGDSRAYRVDTEGNIEQITSDHSFVQALLDAGHITEEQAETHPMGNVLYRALGQTQDLDVDTYNAELQCGEKLVLCSDGLTRHVRSKEIASIAHKHDDPNTITTELINLANERGGEDNISVIAVSVDDADTPPKKVDESAFEDDEDDEPTVIVHPITDTADTATTSYERESQDADLPPPSQNLPQTGRYDKSDGEGQDRSYRK